MTWRLFYVRSGREYAVLAELVERSLDGYVPSETVWAGPLHSRRPQKRPFLPSGYVFADLEDEDFATARQLPDVTGALRIICEDDRRTLEMDRAIGQLLGEFLEPVRKAEREGKYDKTARKGEGLSAGQRVKVVVGAWRGHMATITSLRGKHKLGIHVDGTRTPIEIAAAKVREVEAA